MGLLDDKSTLVQVMAWCHQSTSHYNPLPSSQYRPSSISPYGLTGPQWVKYKPWPKQHVLMIWFTTQSSLQWRHNRRDGVSNHQPHDCLLNHSFRRRSKKTSKLRVTGLCAGNSPVTGEFPTQMASNTENVFIWWRHHDLKKYTSPGINESSSVWH